MNTATISTYMKHKFNNNLAINLYNKTFFFLVEKIYNNKKLETVQ